MVLQLVDEGRVDLDEPLSAHLPDTPIGGDVTTRALLSHRSRLPNCTDVEGLIRDVLADRSRVLTPIDILSYIEAVKPGESDQHFASSNTNDILLGQLVEHLDGADLNGALRNRVTEPLGLDATRFATAAGLLVERRDGTRRLYRARPEGLDALRGLLKEMWASSLDMARQLVEAERGITDEDKVHRAG